MSEMEKQNNDPDKLIGEVFRSDDKLLSSLQKLGWELETEDPEETKGVETLRDICARLIKYTVEYVRTKLDRSYLEGLESYVEPDATNHATKDEVHALQDELESLYTEILPVAQMSVEQQWLEPSLRSLSAKNGQSLGRSAEALSYVSRRTLRQTKRTVSDCLLTRHRYWIAWTTSSTGVVIHIAVFQPSRHIKRLLLPLWTLPKVNWQLQLYPRLDVAVPSPLYRRRLDVAISL